MKKIAAICLCFAMLTGCAAKAPEQTGTTQDTGTNTEEPVKLAQNDVVANTAWISADDNSYMVFEDDRDYIWYRTMDTNDDSYFAGTYDFYMGEPAMHHLTVDLAEYGVAEAEMKDIIEQNDEYSIDNMVCMTVVNSSFMMDGVEQLEEDKPNSYFGFLLKDGTYLDIINMTTGTYYGFTKEATV